MSIKVDLTNSNIDESLVEKLRATAREAFLSMWENTEYRDGEDATINYTGWLDYPNQISEMDLNNIESVAAGIRKDSDLLLVLGTGGSYMGARAVAELLPGDDVTELVFLGFDFNERYIKEVLNKTKGKDFSIVIISKSGGTMEPMVVSSIMIEELKKRYGDEAYSRIYVVTEDKPSTLFDYAKEINCEILPIPENISGRYSVFTAVGLLPLAVHGIDIRQFIAGARISASKDSFADEGLDYAINRLLLGGYFNDGPAGTGTNRKCIEVFEVFNSYAEYLGNWLRQLFGESEGKENKGVFPSFLLFNRDLHSVGQFLQEGSKVFYETMIFLGDADPSCDINVPECPLNQGLTGQTLAHICQSVEKGVLTAHCNDRIPLMTIEIESITPRNIGELMYFFLVQSAVSALLLGVNPFNQPGVEKYKSEVRKLLGL